MAKILMRLPKEIVDEDTKEVVRRIKFDKFYVKDEDKDFSEKRGRVPKEELAKNPHRFSCNGYEYVSLDTDFLDEYKRIKRLAQIITLKDIGRIITLLGLHKDSVLVESGSGSSGASSYLARIVKEIYSYEINEKHLAVAKENISDLGINNVEFILGDVYDEKAMKSYEADAFLLDVPDPKKAMKSVLKALRLGGRVVVYTPNLTQIRDVVCDVSDEFVYETTVELTEKSWEISEKKLRPRMQGLGHTAFLSVFRKICRK